MAALFRLATGKFFRLKNVGGEITDCLCRVFPVFSRHNHDQIYCIQESVFTYTDGRVPALDDLGERKILLCDLHFLCALSGESKSTNPFGKKKYEHRHANHNENDFNQRRALLMIVS